jgi:hypothetical protein
MSPVNVESLTNQVGATEKLLKTGEVRHPLASIVGSMSDIVSSAVTAEPEIKRNALWQKLLDDPKIDAMAKAKDPDSYESMPLMAINSLLGLIHDLDRTFLNNISTILDGAELDQWEKLANKLNLASMNDSKDLDLILKVAKIGIPTLIQDEEYVKQYVPPTPRTTGGGDYGPATGYLGVNEWFIDFRQFRDDPSLVRGLLELTN